MICQNCSSDFPMYKVIDGKRRCFSRRKYCFDCSPFGSKNTVSLVEDKELVGLSKEERDIIVKERSKERNKKKIKKRRKDISDRMIKYKGGCCQICGYNKCSRALHFHHINPKEKEFNLGYKAWSMKWENVVKELDKCILLCSNCHMEVEGGVTELPEHYV